MRAAPFLPGQKMSTTYAFTGDDASLHFDINNLTPRQIIDDKENKDLMGFLQVCLIGLGKAADHAMLYTDFAAPPWPDRLARYAGFFDRMGIDHVPADHWHFQPIDGFYDAIAADLPPTDSITFYMTSGTNGVLHNDPAAYAVSQNVNSKVHFAHHAPAFGINVPDTLVVKKGDLGGEEAAAFMAKHDNQIILKTLGLAGARNVTPVGSIAEAIDYVGEYDDDLDVILQHKLDLSRWTEMTADLSVTPDSITISNVRQIMFADGIWVGNLIGPDVICTPEHEAALLQIGDYARAQGYVEPEGVNCGVDYFIDDDGGFIATEINARWTGGLFPAEMIRQVGATAETCVAFVDLCVHNKFDTYLDFIDRHLYEGPNGGGVPDGAFRTIPLGCSPIPQSIDGEDFFFSWQVIAGDFEAFKQARRDELGPGALDRADAISLVL